MANALIQIDSVSKQFGELTAVDRVSLDIPRGVLFGLIGHNGAGKSTLFKMMLGLIPLSSGEIRIDGQAISGNGFREVRRKVGYLPENVVLYDNLSGLETLQFFAKLKGADTSHCAAVLQQVGLGFAADRRVKGYSKGMRQRLGFAQALLGKPQLLFLDEPTNGLDPEAIREFYRVLHDLRQQGVTVVLTSHILSEIQTRVDELAILQNGKLAARGTVQGLREQVNLPLRVEVQLKPGATSLLEGLREAGFNGFLRDQRYVDIDCHRGDKMRLLAWLTERSSQIGDIQLKEPSLEDVFMGYAAHHGAKT